MSITQATKRALVEAKDEHGHQWTLVSIRGEFVAVDWSHDFPFFWSPSHPMGWQQDYVRRGRISIMSFDAFGSDAYWASKAADAWRRHAQDMYYVLLSQYQRRQKN